MSVKQEVENQPPVETPGFTIKIGANAWVDDEQTGVRRYQHLDIGSIEATNPAELKAKLEQLVTEAFEKVSELKETDLENQAPVSTRSRIDGHFH